MQLLTPENNLNLEQLRDITFRRLRVPQNGASRKNSVKLVTRPSTLPEDQQPKTTIQSDNLWDNLVEYATTVLQGVANGTCELPDVLKPKTLLPFASADERNHAAETFEAWNRFQMSLSALGGMGIGMGMGPQTEILFTLEPTVGSGIRMRYSNTNLISDVAANQNTGSGWIDQHGVELTTPPNVYFPALVRPVPAMFHHPGGHPSTLADTFLLLSQAVPEGSDGNRLVVFVPPAQLLPDRAMKTLIPAGNLSVEDQEWSDVLFQVWDRCHYLNVDYGVLTNGSTVRMFIRTKDDQLCFSGVKNWHDRGVFLALQGLCFVSLDHPVGKNAAVKDHLCGLFASEQSE